MPLTDDPAGRLEKTVGRLTADMDGITGLQNMQFFSHFEHEVGHFADAVSAVCSNPPDINIGKIVVSSTFSGCNADFRRGRMVVDFDPEAAEKLLGLITIQHFII